jgi:hypothetical protein
MQVCQFFPGGGEGGEIGSEGNAREFFFGDGVVRVVLTELREGGVFEVGEGEALGP